MQTAVVVECTDRVDDPEKRVPDDDHPFVKPQVAYGWEENETQERECEGVLDLAKLPRVLDIVTVRNLHRKQLDFNGCIHSVLEISIALKHVYACVPRRRS